MTHVCVCVCVCVCGLYHLPDLHDVVLGHRADDPCVCVCPLAPYGSVFPPNGENHQGKEDLLKNPLHAARPVGPETGHTHTHTHTHTPVSTHTPMTTHTCDHAHTNRCTTC